jgi:hypothetical protein
MTQEDYVLRALDATARVLDLQGIDMLDATVEQAWSAFLCHMAQCPFSPVVQHYSTLGVLYREQFSALWPAFQYEVYRAL